jgi:hypothetical protein
MRVVALMNWLPIAEFDWKAWRDSIPQEYRQWAVYAAIGVIGLVILRTVWRRFTTILRRRRPPTIHPSLQKYNVDHVELDRKRREMAVGVVATSTGNRLAGFRIVRQVEAVFVDGLRTPEEALIALKAMAVERGANALLNVHTERTAGNRCSASADAVVVAPLVVPSSTRSGSPGQPATPKPPAAPPPKPPAE